MVSVLSLCLDGCREVRVTWTTQEGSAPAVKYGAAPGVYSQQQFGTYSTYSAADMCSQPAAAWGFSSPGFINTAVLKGLAPSTTYYYVYGQEVSSSTGWPYTIHALACCSKLEMCS